MKKLICDSRSGEIDVDVKEYEYEEFRKKYWPISEAAESVTTTENKMTGQKVVQYEKFKIASCDICGKRIPPSKNNACDKCCAKADDQKLSFEYPKCKECSEAYVTKAEKSKMYVYESKGATIKVGNHTIKAPGPWGICEKCFNDNFTIKYSMEEK